MTSNTYFDESKWATSLRHGDLRTDLAEDRNAITSDFGHTWQVDYREVSASEAAEHARLWEGVDLFIDQMKQEAMTEGVPAYMVASRAEDLWMATQDEFSNLPIPVVSLGARGGIQFGWWIGEFEVELEIFEDHLELVVTRPGEEPVDITRESGSHDPLGFARDYLVEMLLNR